MSLTRTGFPSFVNRQPAPAPVGGFASMNPRASVLAGAGAFRAASVNNPVVGYFAWFNPTTSLAKAIIQAGVLGFIANELQTMIAFPPSNSDPNMYRLAVQEGFPVTGYVRGDYWTKPVGLVNGTATPGDKVYARNYDGAPTNDATDFSATGVQSTTTMTISAVTKGQLVPGMHLSGTNAASVVVAQLTGTAGGAGTYQMSVSETVGSATVTSNAVDTGFIFGSAVLPNAVTDSATTIAAGTGVMTVAAVASGVIEQGQNVSGTGVPANLFVQAQLTGTPGGAGTYQLNTIGPAVAAFTATLSQGGMAKISRV